MQSIRLNSVILMLLTAFFGQAAGIGSEYAIGRAYYLEGDFKRAAAHFQLAFNADPNDAESCYWAGLSNQGLADIATPFGGRYHSKARVFLMKATELAPGRPDYRKALFDFLLESARSSRTALKQAARVLQTVPEQDPDYGDMRRRFEYESEADSSTGARVSRLVLFGPQAVYRIAELPLSALPGRPALGTHLRNADSICGNTLEAGVCGSTSVLKSAR
jgi:tetratricopeptide (TPR) repeat protein